MDDERINRLSASDLERMKKRLEFQMKAKRKPGNPVKMTQLRPDYLHCYRSRLTGILRG